MKLINCTPHMLNIHHFGGILRLSPSGILPRLDVTRENVLPVVAQWDEVINVARTTLGELTGLPSAEDGVVLITSALVADAAKRPDVMSPGELVRNSEGDIVGCRGLCTYI